MNNTSIDIVEFFQNLDCDNITDWHHGIVDKICKKIDVTKVVRKAYDIHMMQPMNEEVLNDEELDIMIKGLITYYIQFKNYKVLNSLLKIANNILYPKHQFMTSENHKNRIYELSV